MRRRLISAPVAGMAGKAPIGFMMVKVTSEGMETREIITGEYADNS